MNTDTKNLLNRIREIINKNKYEARIKSDQLQILHMYCNIFPHDIEIKIGNDIIDFADEIKNEINNLREKIYKITGVIIPVVILTNDCNIQENEYKIYLQGENISSHYTIPKLEWAKSEILYNLEKCLKENIDKVITNKLVEKYINKVREENSWLIWEITCTIKPSDIKIILTNLLKKEKDILNLVFIFEKIAYYAHLGNPESICQNISKELKSYDWNVVLKENKIILPKL